MYKLSSKFVEYTTVVSLGFNLRECSETSSVQKRFTPKPNPLRSDIDKLGMWLK